MRQRFIDINFDEKGIPKTDHLGYVMRGTDGVIVLRVNLDAPVKDTASMHVSFERPDGKIGTGFMKRRQEEGQAYFTYVLTSWATASKGDLKLSFSLRYNDPLDSTEIKNDTEQEIYPVDYMRLVKLRVEESVEDGDLIGESPPSAFMQVVSTVTQLEEDVSNIQLHQTGQDGRLDTLDENIGNINKHQDAQDGRLNDLDNTVDTINTTHNERLDFLDITVSDINAHQKKQDDEIENIKKDLVKLDMGIWVWNDIEGGN